MSLFNRYYLLLFFVACGCSMAAQDRSNKGKEFWLGYGHNVLFTQASPPNSQEQVLYLSAEQAATVTVSVNNSSWSRTVNIPTNSVDFSVSIPKTGPEDARLTGEGLFSKGIHIVSDVPIVVYAHQYNLFSSAATMLMPVETYGYTYYSLNFTQTSNYPDSYSWFYVIASEDNTRIEISPSDSTEGGLLPGQIYTVNLNKGQLYNVFGKKTGSLTGKDITGSKVVSIPGADGNCHPVALFSGSSRIVVCDGNGGEVMQQQIFPANAWGTSYITYHIMHNPSMIISDPFLTYYRVAVRDPSTIVKRNGVPLTGLINNFYYEFTSHYGDHIEADKPVLVGQYTVSTNECNNTSTSPYGDPEMIYLSPIEQGVRSAVFYSTRTEAIDLNFINVIIPQNALSSLRIDGAAVTPAEFITHPANSNYAVVAKRLWGPAAQHTISSDSTFIATVYGLGIFESYGYNMGTKVNNLDAYSEIKNGLNTTGNTDSFTCPKTPVRLFIKLAYPATRLHWKLGAVPGISPAADSVIINPVPVGTSFMNNRLYYTYTLQQDFIFSTPGTYYIPVSYSSPGIDACNQTETATIAVLVKPGPKADFTVTDPACLADPVLFNSAAVPGTFTLTGHQWLFQDNSTVTTVNADKLFTAAGNQQVKYMITTYNGCIADTTKTVMIYENPVASFSTSNPPYCTSQPITVSSTAAGISEWNWDMGNAVRTSVSPFSHSYTTAGNYTIQLITKNAAGCLSDTATRLITVATLPVVHTGADTVIRVGNSVTLNAVVTPPGNYTYTWSPATYLSNSTVLHPVATPDVTTSYQLQAVDPQSGCMASDDVVITAVSALFIPTAFTPNNDGKNDRWVIPGLALYPEARVVVFNREGQKIFDRKGYTNNAWDGTYKGEAQPNAVYVYMIELGDRKTILKGTLTLVR